MLTPEGAPAIADWSLARDTIHLNHGSYGAVTLAAQERQLQLRAAMDANPCAWFTRQQDMVAAARVGVAGFLGVPAGDLALVGNASAGITAVYNSLPFTQGAEIVTTNHVYGAVLEGARRTVRRHDGQVHIAQVPLDADSALVVDLVMAQVNPLTQLIVIDQITSATAAASRSRRSPRPRSSWACRYWLTAPTRPGCLAGRSPVLRVSGWATCTSSPAHPAGRRRSWPRARSAGTSCR